MRGYLTCGWILPAAVMTPYVIYKQVSFTIKQQKSHPLCFQFLENTECWMKTGHSDWFLALPVLFTIVLNIYFLVRVIMILR